MPGIDPGRPEPLGLTLVDGGANLAVFSAEAERIELCLFDAAGAETRLALPARSGDVHHGFVPGVGAGQVYGLRAHGPWRPGKGLRFDPSCLLLDPYATRVLRPAGFSSAVPAGAGSFDDLAQRAQDTAPGALKAIAEATPPAGRRPTRPRPASRVVYELSVKGFTAAHPNIPSAQRGTFAGLAHPAAIAHLVGLGITTVELMPIMAWTDERHLPPLGLANAWGYNTAAFLAPDPRLAPGGMAEVAAAVDALHEAGLEVILDIVLNHTAESDERGATLGLRGLDNRTYYRLAENPRYYANDTGCGNTLALDRPPVLRLAMDALRHWAEAGGVDGFRFDLATVLGRRPDGFDPAAPLLAAIAQDPVLRDRVMIAEPWDVGWGGYQLGAFPKGWSEWNDRFRDDVRRFWRGDGGAGALATRLAGSADVFGGRHRRPSASLNFLAAHDGFTLADVVAYRGKHNEANGEANRDGKSDETCWAVGGEGPAASPAVAAARRREVKALLATLLVARGTPMIGMGDELGRSQRGNNNAYAQDNALTWLDWAGADRDLAAFVGQAVRLRLSHPALRADRFLAGTPGPDGIPDAAWLHPEGRVMQDADWAEARTLGLAVDGEGARALVWINAASQAVTATVPPARPGQGWTLLLASNGQPVVTATCALPARSVIILSEAPVGCA